MARNKKRRCGGVPGKTRGPGTGMDSPAEESGHVRAPRPCKGDFLRAGPEVWLCSHGCGISGGYPLWDPLSHLSGREKAWTPHRAATSARPTADAQRTLKPCVQTHISERSEINRCVCSSPRIDAWEVVDVNLHKGGPRCVSLVSVSHEFVVWPKENQVGS